MPPRRSIRDEDWEGLRPTIRKLYLEEDRNLKDVLLILGTFHSFYPSKAQLEWKLNQWHFTKNMRAMDWKYVGNEIHRRKCRGKESKVYLSGIPLRMKKVERGVSRYCYETAIEKAMRRKYTHVHSHNVKLISSKDVPEPPMPEDQPLLVCTPMPQEMDWPCRLDNVPWLISRRLVEGLLESILFPRFTLQSYTALLLQTFKTLRSIMPEEYGGAHAIRAQDLLQKNRPNTINAESLVCLVFLLSNSIYRYTGDNEQHERYTAAMRLLLRLFRESGSNVLAKGQYSRLPLSLQSSLDGLFREAVKTSDLEAVRLLLQAGVDVDTSFSDGGDFDHSYCTALQYAAASNQPGLLQILIDHGANTQTIVMKTLTRSWLQRKDTNGSPEETMRILLSIYRFRPEDEIRAVHLLFMMSQTARTPVTEAVIGFFRSSFTDSSSAAKAQLLITAIRTNSCFVDDLVAELGHYVNSCGYFPETPMTAAAYKGQIQLCNQLLYSGATFEPRHKAPTPLQWAASFADVSVVQQLLNWGADVNFCHPSPTLLRVGFEDVSSMRFSCWEHFFHPPEQEQTQRSLPGSLGRTALHAALLGGSAATAMCLLDAGATLVGGELVMAIWSRKFEIIENILERGASFQDECTIFGADTVLEAAIISENTGLVFQVVAADSQLVTGKALCASIFLAKATDDCTILRYLLTYTSQLQASEDLWIGMAMCLAAHLQYMEIPEIMLRSGLRPETSWPFHIRSTWFYDHLIQSECSARVSSMARSYLNWQRSLSQYYSHFGEKQQDARRPLVEIAVSMGHWDYLKLLLDNGYQPGATSSLGVRYSRNMDIHTLRLLHNLGIKMKEHILTYVIYVSQDREIIDWLLSVGVDINEMSEARGSVEGIIHGHWMPFTPLQMAISTGDVDLIQQLIDYGADVNQPPYGGGATSLQIAARGGYFGVVQRLLELGACPNAPGCEPPYDRTALEGAAERGRLDVIQLLLNSGAETSGRGRRQFVRSVALAEREGHRAIVRLLKSHAGWTEADEGLLNQKDLFPVGPYRTHNMPAYVRRYYDDESDEEGTAGSVTSQEGQPLDEVEPSTEECRSSGGFRPDSEELASKSEGISQALAEETLSRNLDTSETWLASDDICCRVQELIEEVDEPSETSLSTLDPILNLPDAYEALSEEVGLENLPSSMSYQIREELEEGGGCLERPGGDLWAEEYSRFITELV